MASRKVKKPKKRAQRATSNVFAMFAQDQIQVPQDLYCLLYNRLPARYPPVRPEVSGSYQADRRYNLNRVENDFQEFKEAFNMIDQNRDGFIDRDDLHDMLASLGKGQ